MTARPAGPVRPAARPGRAGPLPGWARGGPAAVRSARGPNFTAEAEGAVGRNEEEEDCGSGELSSSCDAAEVSRDGSHQRAQDATPITAAGGAGISSSCSALAGEALHEEVDAVAPLEVVKAVGVAAGDDDASGVSVRDRRCAAAGGAGIASSEPRLHAVGVEGVGAWEMQYARQNSCGRAVGVLADCAHLIIVIQIFIFLIIIGRIVVIQYL